MKNCHDCGAAPDTAHEPGCDVERCPECGHQRIGCDCDTDAPPLLWTGMWPGEAECIAWGWHAFIYPGRGWVRCAADHPECQPDLNRLYIDAKWNPTARTWEKRE